MRWLAGLFGFLAALLPATAIAGIIDPSRSTDWTQAGVLGGIPIRTTICATLNPGATATQITEAISACPSGQVVFLNAGTYNLSAGIVFDNKSNVTLRGAGPDQTFLIFTGGDHCAGLGGDVCFKSGDPNDGFDGPSNIGTWTAGYSVGTTSITLGSITRGSIDHLQVGSVIFLDQLDDTSDPGDVYVCQTPNVCSMEVGSKNGRPSRGQQEPQVVTSISGSGPWTVGISPGVRMPNISSGKSPEVWWLNGLPVQNDGVENLSMDHTGTGAAIAAGTFMINGYNNWLKNVRDLNSHHKHVWLYQSIHITIRDSYFYGSSEATSESYGVDTYNGADNLVENNIFQHIAAPMMNEGCIGCVGAYNFAFDDWYTADGESPEWQQASSYHHSVGDAFILWEGNDGIGLTADDIHGTSNFITAFRNFWNGRDPAGGGTKTSQTSPIILNAYNRYYNLIGNVLGTVGYHTQYQAAPSSATDAGNEITADRSIYGNLGYSGDQGTYASPIDNDMLVLSTLMRWGNYDTVSVLAQFNPSEVPSDLLRFSNRVPPDQRLPPSLYLSSQPSWWGAMPWPAIGPDVTGGEALTGHVYRNPAHVCYDITPKDSNGILLFHADACYAGPAMVTVLESGLGSGTVTITPPGIDCVSACSVNVASGTTVTLTATAAPGAVFRGWSGGACSGVGSCVINATRDVVLTAAFEALFTVTVVKAGAGSGTVMSSLPGITCGTSCSAVFASGMPITLTAAAAPGSVFAGWSGGGCSDTGPCSVSGPSNVTITSTFLQVFTLDVMALGSGSGTVTSSPMGITCGAICSASFANGTTVTLTARPAAGSAFTGWTGGGCSGTEPCTVTVSAATTVTATFTPTFVLSMTTTGTGTGTVTSSPAGIDCGASCTASFASGTTVTLTARPAAGSAFTGWTGGGCSGTEPCTVTVSAATTVTATFTPTFVLTVTPAGTGSGTVTSSLSGISCGMSCSAVFASGAPITLVAIAAPGSVFAGWSGGSCSGTGPCAVSGPPNVTITATFLQMFTLAVVTSGSGSGTVTITPPGLDCGTTCSVTVTSGTTVILTPMPAAGSAAFWSAGGLCSRTGACSVTVTANATVTVTFEPIGTFTDAVLTPLGTAVKAVHFLELRADIDALRQNHGLSPFAWTDPALIPGVAIARSVHLIELRSAVSQVYVSAGRVAPMFTESGIASGVTVIKTIHINELRSAVIGLR